MIGQNPRWSLLLAFLMGGVSLAVGEHFAGRHLDRAERLFLAIVTALTVVGVSAGARRVGRWR